MSTPQPPATSTSSSSTSTSTSSSSSSSGHSSLVITPATLKTTLTEKLEASFVDVEDISGGCGSSFQAKIVSPLFAKKTSLARHRLVNAALKTEIAAIHAWTPKCFTPEEWEKRNQGDAAAAAAAAGAAAATGSERAAE